MSQALGGERCVSGAVLLTPDQRFPSPGCLTQTLAFTLTENMGPVPAPLRPAPETMRSLREMQFLP